MEDIGASKSLCAVRLPHAMVPVYAFGLIQRNCARQLFNAFGAISHALAAANARNFEFINSIFLKKIKNTNSSWFFFKKKIVESVVLGNVSAHSLERYLFNSCALLRDSSVKHIIFLFVFIIILKKQNSVCRWPCIDNAVYQQCIYSVIWYTKFVFMHSAIDCKRTNIGMNRSVKCFISFNCVCFI